MRQPGHSSFFGLRAMILWKSRTQGSPSLKRYQKSPNSPNPFCIQGWVISLNPKHPLLRGAGGLFVEPPGRQQRRKATLGCPERKFRSKFGVFACHGSSGCRLLGLVRLLGLKVQASGFQSIGARFRIQASGGFEGFGFRQGSRF